LKQQDQLKNSKQFFTGFNLSEKLKIIISHLRFLLICLFFIKEFLRNVIALMAF